MDRFVRAKELDAKLGDPYHADTAIPHAVSARWDEEEHYPQEALDTLTSLGVASEFVPISLGGNLRAYDELLYIARVVANRNLTVAVTMSAMIWSTLVWIAGNEEQKKRHAASILAHRTPCLAYSEEAHGADLLASDAIARRTAGGYLVTGRKWPINRATTGQSVVLLARTGEPNDPRALSLFWFEKADLDPACFHPLPRVPTLGVRGTDISGIEFENALVPESSRVGREGAGLEIALKGFHVTRTLCAGLSLGAVDSAIRTTVRLARARRLYENAMIALPQVRKTIVDAYALLLALDAASLAAMRALHVSPSQSASISASIKHAVPEIAEQIVGSLAKIHGARFYMREHHDWGVMQKVYRDNLLIGIFDGSSPVNLSALATELPILARFAPQSLGGGSSDARRESGTFERARLTCTLSVAPPPFDYEGLDLASRGDDMVGSYGLLLDEIERELTEEPLRGLLLPLLRAVKAAIIELYTGVQAAEGRARGRGAAGAPALAELAERFAILFVTVAAIHAWWRRRAVATDRPEAWLVLALRQLLRHGGVCCEAQDFDSIYESLLEDVMARSDGVSGYALM